MLLALRATRRAAITRTVPLDLAVRGDTRHADARWRSSCATRREAQEPSDQGWGFEPARAGRYRVQVRAEFDVTLAVFDATRELVCSDDAMAIAQSEVTVTLQAHARYAVVVDGADGASGPYELIVQYCP